MSPVFNPKQLTALESEWAARLIPGACGPAVKKPVQSVRPKSRIAGIENIGARPTNIPEAALELVLPKPVTSRSSGNWSRFIAADFALVCLNWLLLGALAIGLHIAFPQLQILQFETSPQLPSSLLGIALLHGALITLLGYSEGLYVSDMSHRRRARILVKSITWATGLLCVACELTGVPADLNTIFLAGFLNFGSLYTWRRVELKRRVSPGRRLRNVLVIGAGNIGRRVAQYLERHPEQGRSVYGFLDDDKPLGKGVMGRTESLARVARTGFVDEVILAGPQNRELARRVVAEARQLRLDIEIVPEIFVPRIPSVEIERVAGLPVICVHRERLPISSLVIKRILDLAAAGMALLVLSPLLALIAAAIKLDSKGPVIYAAPRVGRKRNLFRCYKFRTMVKNADALKDSLRARNERSGVLFKIAGDPRITRVGAVLRRYSLDELPQLWNVVKGDMSLVGPRPHPVDDFAAYDIEHLARLDVTPGITGLWQVTARGDPSFEHSVELDREYIRNWSLASDLRIVLKTFSTVIRGSGQ